MELIPGVSQLKFPPPVVDRIWPPRPAELGKVRVYEVADEGDCKPINPETKPDSLRVPFTSNSEPGKIVPIPTFPEL